MTNDKFAHELNSIKYARNAESVEDPTLSAIMKNVPEASMHGISDVDHLPRMVAADKLDELGRDKEAELLRSTDKHVMIHQGKIVPAKFTLRDLIRNLNAVTNHVETSSGHNFTGNFDLINDSEDQYYRPEDFEETPEQLPLNHVRIVHFYPDDYHTYEHVPYHQLVNRVAEDVDHAADIHFVDFGSNNPDNRYALTHEATQAAQNWHGGQSSALYRIASNGGYVDNETVEDALSELNRIKPENREEDWQTLHDELSHYEDLYTGERVRNEQAYQHLMERLRNSSVSEPSKE